MYCGVIKGSVRFVFKVVGVIFVFVNGLVIFFVVVGCFVFFGVELFLLVFFVFFGIVIFFGLVDFLVEFFIVIFLEVIEILYLLFLYNNLGGWVVWSEFCLIVNESCIGFFICVFKVR